MTAHPAAPNLSAPDADSATAAPRQPAVEGAGLQKRAVHAGSWTTLSFGFDQGLSLVSNIVLVYFAVPREAFGLMALIMVVIQGLQMFSDVGITPCLIQNEREDQAFYNTAWTMQAVRGVFLWLVASAAAVPISMWRDDWAPLALLLPVAAFTSVFNGLRSTAWVTAQRRLDVRLLSILNSSISVVRIAVMGVIAWFSPTAWALVGGLLIHSALVCIASHWMIPEIKNRFHFERAAFGSLIRYGKWIFLGTVITFFAGAIDKLLLGSLISVTALGVFFMGHRLAEIGPMLFKKLGTFVGFPALSDVYRRDPDRFPHALMKMRLVLTLPINLLLLLMILTGPMVTWLFYAKSPTPQFIEAGWIVQVLCFNSLAGMVTTAYGNVFLATGRTVFNMWSVFAQLVVMVAATLTGYHYAGETGFILGIGVTQWFKYIADAALAKACGCWQWKFDAAVLGVCGLLAWAAVLGSQWMAERWVL
jgi:O-antigen/teichoic acid export membrane protein